MKKILLPVIFSLFFSSAFAQKEANIWCFGNNAGLDFNSGSPVAYNGTAIVTAEGSASIADRTTGQLLFYTDGITIWDKNNQVMPGGTSLGGNPSSTQSGVIVPMTSDPNKYYVFSVDAQAGAGGVQYALVDMTLNGGLGSVTSANNVLLTPTSEK